MLPSLPRWERLGVSLALRWVMLRRPSHPGARATVAVVWLTLLAPAIATAQTTSEGGTRQSLLDDARRQLESESTPPTRSRVERFLYWYDETEVLGRVFSGRIGSGFHLASGGFPAGAGTTAAVGYDRTFPRHGDDRPEAEPLPRQSALAPTAVAGTSGRAAASACTTSAAPRSRSTPSGSITSIRRKTSSGSGSTAPRTRAATTCSRPSRQAGPSTGGRRSSLSRPARRSGVRRQHREKTPASRPWRRCSTQRRWLVSVPRRIS